MTGGEIQEEMEDMAGAQNNTSSIGLTIQNSNDFVSAKKHYFHNFGIKFKKHEI